jgi:hypothetical protein
MCGIINLNTFEKMFYFQKKIIFIKDSTFIKYYKTFEEETRRVLCFRHFFCVDN